MTKPLHIVEGFTGLSSFTDVEVDVLLHRRGSDFTIYRNGYVQHGPDVMIDKDSPLLQSIVFGLMASETCGVEHIRIQNYLLSVHHSKAVSKEYIIDMIMRACTDAGYTVINQPRQMGSPYRGLRVSELDSPKLCWRVFWRSIVTRLPSAMPRRLAKKASAFVKSQLSRAWNRVVKATSKTSR